MINVEELKENYKVIWWQSSSDINLTMDKTTYWEKKKNEMEFEEVINNIIKYLNEFPREEEKRLDWKLKGKNYLNQSILTKSILGLGSIDKQLKALFLKSTREFIIESRRFDKDISYEYIGQALRNLWIVNIFQKAIGKDIEFTKGVFGYSMLYPYTDNYLDDIQISIDEKIKFNERFLDRLKGNEIKDTNSYEEKVFKLIEYIECQFCRSEFQDVYESLYLIYKGQKKSLNQQDAESIPYEKDILEISLEKGGASVLADGYLINGYLSAEEKSFAYGYGFFLQLADDLQDVYRDLKNKHMTIVSQLATKYPLDKIASKILNLTITVINNEKCFKGDNKEDLKELILNNCIYMMLFAIIDGSEFYSKEYINIINSYLPFSLLYCKNIKKRLKKKFKAVQLSYYEISIEEIILYLIDY